MTILFAIFSILSAPLYYYYGKGGKEFNTQLSIKDALTFQTLGNIGEGKLNNLYYKFL